MTKQFEEYKQMTKNIDKKIFDLGGKFIIFLWIVYFISCFCIFFFTDKRSTSYEELSVMNTVCIDGVLNLSVATKYDLDYVPVVIDGKEIRCGEIDGE